MSSPEQEKLLDALDESSLVKAALVIDHNGHVKSRRGQARALKGDQVAPPPNDEGKPNENVYLIELSQDMLAVVFDDAIEFEQLRRAVDTLIEHAGLEKKEE